MRMLFIIVYGMNQGNFDDYDWSVFLRTKESYAAFMLENGEEL
jgi:hypothetical protein